MKDDRSDKWLLQLRQEMKARPEAAYNAFTRPEELSVWFTEEAQGDLRVGGRYSNSDNDHGEYIALDKPAHVRFTWENEEHCPGTVVDIRFEQVDDNVTQVVLEHQDLPNEAEFEDMKTGWSWALTSLKSYLEQGKPISFEEWQLSRK